MNQAALILHPVRFRILESLSGESLTTRVIADRLSDVPKSTIYRQIKLLLENDMIAIDDTRPVRGAMEKTYRLNRPMRLAAEEVAGWTPEEHIQYFRAYTVVLQQGFSGYVHAAADGGKVDMVADRSGYTETLLFATMAELDEMFSAINQAVIRLAGNTAGEGRHKHRIAFITYPDNQG